MVSSYRSQSDLNYSALVLDLTKQRDALLSALVASHSASNQGYQGNLQGDKGLSMSSTPTSTPIVSLAHSQSAQPTPSSPDVSPASSLPEENLHREAVVLSNLNVGIHEFLLRGRSNADSFTALFMLKFVRKTLGICTLKGFVLPHVPDVEIDDKEYLFPYFVETFPGNFHPHVVLRGVNNERTLDVVVESAVPPPYPFQRLDLPCFVDGVAASYFVEVTNWEQKSVVVTTPAHYVMADIGSSFFADGSFISLWAYVNDFKSYGNVPVADHVRNMEAVFNYSQRIGFSSMFVYLHPYFYVNFVNHASSMLLQRFADRSIFFYLVDGVPEFPRQPYKWREYYTAHALLAAWGHDVYLTLFDRDEVLGLPLRSNLTELVTTGCLKDASLIRLPMALKVAPAAAREENRDGDYLVLKEADPHASYTLGCNATIFNYKNLFHPNGTLWVNVHDGWSEPGFSDKKVTHDCAYYAHGLNYWAKRQSVADIERIWQCSIRDDKGWLWMYE